MRDDWIIVQGESWTRLSRRGVERLEPFPRLRRPSRLIADFRQAHTGVIRFEGPVKYARALIDREVRREGWVDGPTHIVLHELLRKADGGQAFFTAVSLADWQRVMTWAGEQNVHCLVFPLAGLLGQPKDGEGTVVHLGQRLIALHRENGDLSFEDVFASSTDRDDLLAAAESLGRRLRETGEQGDKPARLDWRTVLGVEEGIEEGELADRVQAVSGRSVKLGRQPLFESDGGKAPSSLPKDGLRLGIGRTLNDWPSRLAWMTEKAAPLVMVLMAIAAGLIGFAGQMAHDRAATLERDNQPLRAEVSEARERLAAFEPQSLDERLAALDRFVKALDAGQDFGPMRVLSDLKASAGSDIRVHRVLFESTRRGGERLRVDGRIEGDDAAREFLTRLRDRGWEVEPLQPAGENENSFSYRLSPREASA